MTIEFIDKGNKKEVRERKGRKQGNSFRDKGKAQSYVSFYTYILVAHIPIGSFSVRHDLPHDDTEAPDV